MLNLQIVRVRTNTGYHHQARRCSNKRKHLNTLPAKETTPIEER